MGKETILSEKRVALSKYDQKTGAVVTIDGKKTFVGDVAKVLVNAAIKNNKTSGADFQKVIADEISETISSISGSLKDKVLDLLEPPEILKKVIEKGVDSFITNEKEKMTNHLQKNGMVMIEVDKIVSETQERTQSGGYRTETKVLLPTSAIKPAADYSPTAAEIYKKP